MGTLYVRVRFIGNVLLLMDEFDPRLEAQIISRSFFKDYVVYYVVSVEFSILVQKVSPCGYVSSLPDLSKVILSRVLYPCTVPV